MRLKKRIEEKKQEFQSSAPEEVQEVMERAMGNLQRSGIEEKALSVGDKAPDFTLLNTNGDPVNLKDALGEGPVVLGFYRGRW